MLETAKTLAHGNPWAFQVWYEGLTSEDRLGLKAALGLDAFAQACEALVEVFEQIREAVVAAVQVIVAWVKTFYPFLSEPWRRLMLYDRLSRWYVPHWLALWLAQYWPRRWLPGATGLLP